MRKSELFTLNYELLFHSTSTLQLISELTEYHSLYNSHTNNFTEELITLLRLMTDIDYRNDYFSKNKNPLLFPSSTSISSKSVLIDNLKQLDVITGSIDKFPLMHQLIVPFVRV